MPNLCQLMDVKDWLNIVDVSADTTLTRLIESLSFEFLREIKRPELAPGTDWTEVVPGNGMQEMFVRYYPINSIASVTVNGVAIPASPDGGVTDGYWFNSAAVDIEDRIKISLSGYWFTQGSLPSGGSWSYNALSGSYPLNNVVLAYNAGYEIVPKDIEQAMIEWVCEKFKGRQWIGQSSKHMANGESVSFLNRRWSPSVQGAINRYTRHTFGS